MKSLSIREMRSALTRLDKLLAKQGEVIITRRGKPFARVLPMPSRPKFPSNKDLRDSMPFQKVPSEVYIREDRDAR